MLLESFDQTLRLVLLPSVDDIDNVEGFEVGHGSEGATELGEYPFPRVFGEVYGYGSVEQQVSPARNAEERGGDTH